MSPGVARQRLLALLRVGAVLRGDFVLSSGKRSTYYLDARRVTLSAEGSGLVGQVFLEALAEEDIQAVAGLAVGADPIVTAIAVVSGLAGRPLDALIVRKKAKMHGTGGRIVGPWRAGVKVAVVDDAFTTGASGIEAARAVDAAGGTVRGIYALIDREEGARAAVEHAGYRFERIFAASEVVGP